MKDEINNLVTLNVFVHSHAENGEPCEIGVFEISGRVHMTWFTEALEPDGAKDKKELAELFYEHLGVLDVSAWFLCRMCTENPDDGIYEHYVEVITKINAEFPI